MNDSQAILDSLRQLVRGLRIASSAAERKAGLSGAQLLVLQLLAEGPALSLNALAQRTRTDQSSVSVVVQRLVERSLVKRRRAEDDARRVELEITPAGRARLDEAPAPLPDPMLAAIEQLPPRSRQGLAETLSHLVRDAGLRKPEASPEPKALKAARRVRRRRRRRAMELD